MKLHLKNNIQTRISRTVSFVLALICVLGLLPHTTPVAEAASPLPSGVYVFYTNNKLMNWNAIGARGNGTEVGTDNPDGQTNELIIVEQVGTTGYISLRFWHAKDCYISGEQGKGNPLILRRGIPNSYACHWKPVQVSDGRWQFINRQTGLAADVINGWIWPEDCGTRLISWSRSDYADAQYFYPVRISELTSSYMPSSRAYPQNNEGALSPAAASWMACNSQYAKGLNGRIVLDNISSPLERHETLRWVNCGNGRYSLHLAHAPNLCLVPEDVMPGSQIVLKPYSATDPACHWTMYNARSGGYYFRNCKTLMFLDNTCNRTHAGNPIIQYSWTGGHDPQTFILKRSGTSSSSSTVSSASVSSTEQTILNRLTNMMNGSSNSGTYRLNTRYRGPYYSEQCKGFAKSVFERLFGYNIGSTCAKPNNYKLNISTSRTALVGSLTYLPGRTTSNLRDLFDDARAGDFIQVRRSHSGSHSMIFLSSDSNSVTVYECNVDGRNGIVKNTYSWQKFRTDNESVSVYTAKDYRLR